MENNFSLNDGVVDEKIYFFAKISVLFVVNYSNHKILNSCSNNTQLKHAYQISSQSDY